MERPRWCRCSRAGSSVAYPSCATTTTVPSPRGITIDDWDPVARERLRDRIRLTNSGDTLLLLDDDDLDHALLMVVDGPYGPQPSLARVLTIGKVDAIRRSMPMASEVFQVMKGASLAVNAEPFADAVG